MGLSERQRQFTARVAELVRFAFSNGLELTFGEAYRTEEQQRLHLQSGKTRTMASPHRDRLAVDLNLFIGGKYVTDGEAYRPLGEKWEALGGKWGGRFGLRPHEYGTRIGWDANHFEF